MRWWPDEELTEVTVRSPIFGFGLADVGASRPGLRLGQWIVSLYIAETLTSSGSSRETALSSACPKRVPSKMAQHSQPPSFDSYRIPL